MDTSDALVNLAPLLRLMLMGLALALGPLAWIWLRSRGAPAATRLHALAVLTLFLTFDLVLFGAFTRLTDSGLGCPDWPGCYGHASPVGAAQQIAQAQAALPSGPVTHGKAWIEMLHRYLATGVGVLILTLAVSSRLERQRLRGPGGWSMLTLAWVCLQGAFGALTVTWRLFPVIVTLHLLGGMVLLALLQWQAEHYRTQPSDRVRLPGATRWLLVLAYGLLWLQIALGGWVSTNYAVLICGGFPACQGVWWPAMDFAQGFSLWRELGQAADGASISVQALTAIQMAHRWAALLVLVILGGLAWSLYRTEAVRRPARWLGLLLLLQLLTGLSNVVLDWPLLAAVLHTGGAAGMVLVLTALLGRTCAEPRSRHPSPMHAERQWV